MTPIHFRKVHSRSRQPAAMVPGLRAAMLMVVLAAQAFTQPAPDDVIRVSIRGLRSDRGRVLCALFSSAKDFPKNGEKAMAHAEAGIAAGKAVCEFNNVGPGRYAVSVFHDENSNGKMDTNFVGMPREGVGASNNAVGHFGPPKFDAAAFSYSGGRLELAITVVYLQEVGSGSKWKFQSQVPPA